VPQTTQREDSICLGITNELEFSNSSRLGSECIQNFLDTNNPSRNDENAPMQRHDSEISPGDPSPEKRWGHTSVAAYNRVFVIGGYNG